MWSQIVFVGSFAVLWYVHLVGLNRNVLKIIAMVAMTIDHVGYYLLDNNVACRMIGRLAFPIFAFFIAEGCRYTKHKARYFGLVFGVGVVWQIIEYFLWPPQTWLMAGNILLQFAVSIALIFAVNRALQQQTGGAWLLAGLSLLFSLGLGFLLDYGPIGVILPLLIYLAPSKWWQMLAMGVGLILMCWLQSTFMLPWQWCSLLALLPLSLYNGQRGRWRMKYFFYLYYPAHLLAIFCLSLI